MTVQVCRPPWSPSPIGWGASVVLGAVYELRDALVAEVRPLRDRSHWDAIGVRSADQLVSVLFGVLEAAGCCVNSPGCLTKL